MTNEHILREGCEKLGLTIDDKKINQLIKYKDILVEWNKFMNLTGITEDKEVMIKHFLDSLSCLSLDYIKSDSRIIDVGTGAGFPGLPIKIFYENSHVTLLDSLNKRIKFLKEVCEQNQVQKVEFIHGRAEEIAKKKDQRETYDIAVARAVARLNVLCEYCLPFVKVGGYFVCQKGPSITEELEDSKKALNILGGEIVEKIDIDIPYTDLKHNIVVIKKIKSTPTKYPRKAGTPTKSPL